MHRGDLLAEIIGKTVDRVFAVDYISNQLGNGYAPFRFLITFVDHDHYLDVEGDIDGEHLELLLTDTEFLDAQLKELDLGDHRDLWKPYPVTPAEPAGTLPGKTITAVQYAAEKPSFDSNGRKREGGTHLFNGLRLYHGGGLFTFFEMGLAVFISTDPEIVPPFPETYEWHSCEA